MSDEITPEFIRLADRAALIAALAAAREENGRLREALERIADHPCPNRDCGCGPAPNYDSMGRIARMALGLPEPAREDGDG